ncbi:MAG: GspMb/PilO family protein [Desulfuromonadales bacterium]
MDRSLLIVLVITAAFIFYIKPAREKGEQTRMRLSVVESQIATQEAIKRGSADFKKRVEATGKTATTNETYLYPSKTSASLALVDLQDFVKSTATATKMEITTSTWGEPVVDGTTGMTRIPMTFMLKGVPADVDQFLQKLLYGNKFIKIERASVSRLQDQLLVLNLSLVAFKRGGTP